MPENSGAEYYRKIRGSKDFKKTPVIIAIRISGKHLAVQEPFGVVDKPIDKEILYEKIRKAFK